jgi:hypothetical protein
MDGLWLGGWVDDGCVDGSVNEWVDECMGA